MSLSISLLGIIISLLSQNDVVSSKIAPPRLVHTSCIPSAGNYTAGGSYQKSLGKALATLTAAAVSANATFSNTTVGDGVDEVFALYYCTGEDTAEECRECIQAATAKVVEMCPGNKEVVIWYIQCTLRYANRMIFGVEEDTPWNWLTSNKTVADYNNLARVITNTTVDAVEAAALNTTSDPPNYAWREVGFTSTETLVVLAQCQPGVTGVPCYQCLAKASNNLNQCCILFSYVNMAFLPSCRLLSFVQTSNSTSTTTTPPPSSNSPASSPPAGSTPSSGSPPHAEPSTSSNTSNNGTVGSDGEILKCRNNVIAVVALTLVGVCMSCRPWCKKISF